MPKRRTAAPSEEAQPVSPAEAGALIDPVLTNEATFQTLRWLVEGQHEKHVIEALAAQFPAADPAATLAAVMAHLAALAQADPLILRGFALAAYREIYQRCLATGDFANALRCVKELDRIAAPRLPLTDQEPPAAHVSHSPN